MSSRQRDFTIDELAERGGVSVRTVRYYITEGLLPGPQGRGKTASYSEEHLLRLRLIRRLVEQRVPLAEIRDRLNALSVDEVRALLGDEERHAAALDRIAEEPSPTAYVAALLSRARRQRHHASQPDMAFSQPLPQAPPAARPPATTPKRWTHWQLAPGVELHVRADAEQREQDLIERLLRASKTPQEPNDQS